MAHYSMFSSQAPQELQIVIDIHINLNTFRTIYDERKSKILHSVIGRILYAGDFSRNGKLPANVLMGQGDGSSVPLFPRSTQGFWDKRTVPLSQIPVLHIYSSFSFHRLYTKAIACSTANSTLSRGQFQEVTSLFLHAGSCNNIYKMLNSIIHKCC